MHRNPPKVLQAFFILFTLMKTVCASPAGPEWASNTGNSIRLVERELARDAQCNAIYGNPAVRSCLNALAEIPWQKGNITFQSAPIQGTLQSDEAQLPWLARKGNCIITVDGSTDNETWINIFQGASWVMRMCLSQEVNPSGGTQFVGDLGHLTITVSAVSALYPLPKAPVAGTVPAGNGLICYKDKTGGISCDVERSNPGPPGSCTTRYCRTNADCETNCGIAYYCYKAPLNMAAAGIFFGGDMKVTEGGEFGHCALRDEL
ncbi:MAG: hypothetical protein M1827_007253 [Pycnora praestabilis]|nr:MAG: hypothetical protein M1827_007253 [Pycnora praestabilis]